MFIAKILDSSSYVIGVYHERRDLPDYIRFSGALHALGFERRHRRCEAHFNLE